MAWKATVLLACLCCFFFSACVSKKEYVELETRSSETQSKLNDELAEQRTINDRLRNRNRSLLETVEALKFELKEEKRAVQQKETVISELERTRRDIETSLKDQIAQKDIKLEEIEGKLKVTFIDKILFDSGSVTVKEKGREVLLKLADSFRDEKNQTIVVEGHTDDVQIGGVLLDRFPSNWELSTARASAVVRFLQEKGKIEPERLTASGFGFYRPVSSNETEEGRSQNRRIEIILAPMR